MLSFVSEFVFACLLAVPWNACLFDPLLVPTPPLTSFLCLQIELEAILGLNQDLLPPLDENGQIVPNKLSKVRVTTARTVALR